MSSSRGVHYKSLVVDLGKVVGEVGVKGLARLSGSSAWASTRNWLGKVGWEQFDEQAFHHWLIPQRQWGGMVPDFVKNQPWNLMRMPEGEAGRVFHNAIEGKGRDAMMMPGRLWYGSPGWTKALLSNALLRGTAHYEPEW